MPDSLEDADGVLFEFGKVVVLAPHQVAQLDVGSPGLFGRRRTFVAESLDLALQREHGAKRLGRHGLADPERLDPERAERLSRHRSQQAELRLSLAGLDHRQLARNPIDGHGELVERHSAGGAQLTDASADREGIHLFIVVGLETDNRACEAAHTRILSRKENLRETSHADRQGCSCFFTHSGGKPTEAHRSPEGQGP